MQFFTMLFYANANAILMLRYTILNYANAMLYWRGGVRLGDSEGEGVLTGVICKGVMELVVVSSTVGVVVVMLAIVIWVGVIVPREVVAVVGGVGRATANGEVRLEVVILEALIIDVDRKLVESVVVVVVVF